MKTRLLLVLAAASACPLVPAPAAADDCDGIYRYIRSEIFQVYNMDVTCRALRAAAKVLPVTTISETQGLWVYAGEQELRDGLKSRFNIRVSTTLLPLGFLERDVPEGGGYLLVFGLELPRRSWGLLAVSQSEKAPPTERAAAEIGEGASYDRLGVYFRDKDGRYPGEGRWLALEHGGFFSAENPAPAGEARSCAPCKGWLCPPEAAACFSAFRRDRREELLLADDCKPSACGMRLLEPDGAGGMKILFDEPGVSGRWDLRPGGWVLVPQPLCPWGEYCGEGDASAGNPNCERPDVYAFDKNGRLRPDPDLKDEFYPIERSKAPPGCVVEDKNGVLLWTKDRRFVRLMP